MTENKNEATSQQITFDASKKGLASPEKLLEWSHCQVRTQDTINYRPV